MVDESGYRLNKKEQKMYERALLLSLYKAMYEAGRITVEQCLLFKFGLNLIQYASPNHFSIRWGVLRYYFLLLGFCISKLGLIA